MDDMKFHLAFILDEKGNNSINLITFKTLKELDNYIMKHFQSTEDVRRVFDQDISEFCLDNMDFIRKENERNNRDWLGSVVIIAERWGKTKDTRYFHKIKVLYRGMKILGFRDSIKKIREELQDADKLSELRKEKSFLLSPNEKSLLYRNDHSIDDYYMQMALDFFVNRLKKNDEWSYYVRRSLTNLCHLDVAQIKTKQGKITVRREVPREAELSEFEPSVHFKEVVNSQNDEEMYNFYDLDYLAKHTKRLGGK